MDMQNIGKTRVPAEIKRAVAASDGDPRWKNIEVLMDQEELSYTQLQDRLGISKSDLTYHLDKLVKGAILDNYSKNELSTRYGSYYALSPFGLQILKGLIDAVQPSTLLVRRKQDQ